MENYFNDATNIISQKKEICYNGTELLGYTCDPRP